MNWIFEVDWSQLQEFQKKLEKFYVGIPLWGNMRKIPPGKLQNIYSKRNERRYTSSYFSLICRQHRLPKDVSTAIQNGEDVPAFDYAWSGFLEFCRITRQIPTANRDLLHVPDHLREKGLTSHTENLDIFSMTEDNLLRTYYAGLLKRSKTKAEAARRAGLHRSTFEDTIKRYGLS